MGRCLDCLVLVFTLFLLYFFFFSLRGRGEVYNLFFVSLLCFSTNNDI